MDSADFGLYGYDVGNTPCSGWFWLFTTSELYLVLFSGQSRTHKCVLFVLIYHDVLQNSYFIVSDGSFRFDVGWLAGSHWNYNSHQPFHCDFRYTAIDDWL